MKYPLSFCEITQINDNIFEAIEHEDVTIDKECADESWRFWDKLRTEPFGLLVHCSEIPLSFQGAQKIGAHPLQKKTALLINTVAQENKIEQIMDIKNSVGSPIWHKVFYDKEKAIEWLHDLE